MTINYNNKKIAFIAHDNKLYGSNRSLISIVNKLVEYNYDISLIMPLGSEEIKTQINPRVLVCIIDYDYSIIIKNQVKGKKRKIKFIGKKLLGYFKVIKFLIKLKPDIIYTNNSIVNHGIFASLLLRIPHIWQFRESVIQHNQVFNNLTYDFGQNIQKWLYSKSKIRISNSSSLRNDYIQNFKVDSKVVYNGVIKLEEISSEPRILTNKEITLAIIGGISDNKGQIIAAKAIEILNDKSIECRLLIAGEGDTAAIKQSVNPKTNNHIHFLGFVKEVSQVYRQTDILLICSQYESFGRTAVEAFALGIPVISSKCGGPEEIINEGSNGYFFNRTPEDLADKIILAINTDKYLDLSNGALLRAKNFTIENNVSNLNEIFNSCT